MDTSRRQELLDELRRAEKELAVLERRKGEVLARIASARAALSARARVVAGQAPAPSEPNPGPKTPEEKVRLFRSIFRGRTDVFPTRFVNSRSGKAGYAPACANKFVRGTCELPKVKCGECPNQAFLPADDRAILDHLRGRHVMGVYPLQQDETCWFLAVDFDKGSWQEDVTAFRETCLAMDVPCAIERSRSGNGAHAWFFFASPVPAVLARKMGCYLITETMARRHQLRMDSYDRLFPNQDTMPRGGFGNLIALPLQHEARKHGNTLFVDDGFEPWPDPWGFLAAMPRMELDRIESIANEALQRGLVLGVRNTEPGPDDDTLPWMTPPSGRRTAPKITEPLPREVHAIQAQRIFVEKNGLPSAFLNQIKRLAAFQNPEFYKKQRMRLSTALTPRVIACADDLGQHIALPRGCLGQLAELLAEHGVQLALDDQRVGGDPIEIAFHGELTSVQTNASKALLSHDTGVFVAPPGMGKTVLGAFMIARRQRTTLVLVHRQPLLDQWVAQLSMFLGLPTREIGRIGGGKSKPSGRVDVAMIQSLVRKDAVDDIVSRYGHVIVDECHHVPAVSFERVLANVKARYVLGLTATPQRRDGHQPILEMQLGPVRFAVGSKGQEATRPFAHRLLVRETGFGLPDAAHEPKIQELYRLLALDEPRNALIAADVIAAVRDGRFPILLTERRDHLDLLAARLRHEVPRLIVLRGGTGAKDRKAAAAQLDAHEAGEPGLVLATGRYIGEGFDSARLDTLFLAMPISWKGTLVQYSGRLHRLHPGKREVQIYDYVDSRVGVLARMYDKRMQAYRAIGYVRTEDDRKSGEDLDPTGEQRESVGE